MYIEERTSFQPDLNGYVVGTVTDFITGEPISTRDPLPIKSQFAIHTPSQLSTENAGFLAILFSIENISVVLENLNWD